MIYLAAVSLFGSMLVESVRHHTPTRWVDKLWDPPRQVGRLIVAHGMSPSYNQLDRFEAGEMVRDYHFTRRAINPSNPRFKIPCLDATIAFNPLKCISASPISPARSYNISRLSSFMRRIITLTLVRQATEAITSSVTLWARSCSLISRMAVPFTRSN
jgi:hypothetical protein